MTEPLRFHRILVATDFSETADRALAVATELARAAGSAELLLVHANFMPREIEALAVYGPEKVFEKLEVAARAQLDKRLAGLAAAGIAGRQLHADGRPDELILKLAGQESADLIVMGTHGRSGLSRLLMGSVAERVLRQASCPVMTVPPEEEVAV